MSVTDVPELPRHHLDGGVEVLATVEVHLVAAQPVELVRFADGTVEVRALEPYWTPSPFSSPDGTLWHVESERWGTASDVGRWARVPDPHDELGHTVEGHPVVALGPAVRALDGVRQLAAALEGMDDQELRAAVRDLGEDVAA